MADLLFTISGDAAGLVGAVGQSEAALGRLEGSGTKAGSALTTMLGAGVVAGAAALAGGLTAAVGSAMNFEKQMSAVGAVAGATAGEMQSLTKLALQLGKDTSFSASEAASGLEEIIKAGISVEQAVGGAGRAVLDLAAASGTAVDESARIMSNALNTFKADNMSAADAANLLAGAANASATSVHELGYGLSSVGNVAATVGLNFQDTASALALFAQNGLKGSDAGTSLKTMLLNLQPSTENQVKAFQQLGLLTFDTEKAMAKLASAGITPVNTSSGALYDSLVRLANGIDQNAKITPKMYEAFNKSKDSLDVMKNAFFDANGNIKSMAEISEILQKSLAGMTKQQQIATLETMFGTDAIRAAAILTKEGAAGFDAMTAAMKEQGDTQKIANERLNNLAGSLEKLKGSLETAAIMIGGMMTPALKTLVDQATDGVNKAIEIIEQLPDAWRTIGQAFERGWEPSTTLTPFMNAVGLLGIAFRDMYDTVEPIINELGAIIQKVLAQDITGALDQFVALVGSVSAQLAPILMEWGRAFIDWVAPMIPPFLAAVADIGMQLLTWIAAQVSPLLAQLMIWGQQFIAWVAPQIPPMLAALADLGAQALAWIAAQVQPILAQLLLWGQQFVAWVAPQIGPMLSELGKLILAGLDWITAQVPGITASLVEWGLLFGAWVATTAIPELVKALPGIAKTLFDWALQAQVEIVPRMAALGVAIVEGIVQGIVSAAPKIGIAVGRAVTSQMPSWLGGPSNAPGPGGLGALDDYDAQAIAAAKKYGLEDPIGFAAQLRQESGNYAEDVVSGRRKSSAGATGIAQFMPETARKYGVDPTDPIASIDAAARYMADLKAQYGSQSEAAARYFGAPGANSQDGRQYLNAIENQRKNVRMPSASVPQVSQFALGLAPDDAMAACGPAALAWFMNQTGQTPTGEQAKQLAAASGWDAQRGMYGPGAFGSALASAGIPNTVDRTPTAGEVGALAASGNPFAISTGGYTDEFGQSHPGHYYQVQGGSLEGLNVGLSGTALKGGAPTMSLAQIEAMSGPMNAIITLSGQMGDALTTAGQQGGQAFDGLLVSATAMADGSTLTVTKMGTDITATITDAAGQVTAQYGTMATGVAEQATTMATTVIDQGNLMASGALTSVTQLGDGTLTTVQTMAGTTIATVTDMAGQVTNQSATLANGVVLNMGDMSAGVLTSVTQMGDGTITTMTDAAGNAISTVTDMAGQVTNQYVTMGSAATGAVQSFASETSTAFESVKEPADIAKQAMEDVGNAQINAPDVSDVIGAMEDVEDAAKKAHDAIKDITQAEKGGSKSGGSKSNPFGKAVGGPVYAGQTNLVGELGPELVTWGSNGYVHTAAETRGMLSDGPTADQIADAITRKLAPYLQRPNVNVNGAGTEEVISRVLRELRAQDADFQSLRGSR